MTNKPRDQFEELSIPRKEVPKLASRYRVYKDSRNYIGVEAENALEALKQSGLQQAYRIERDSIFLNNVLDLGKLSNQPAPAAQAAAQPAAQPSPAAAAFASPVPETNAPRSPEAQAQPAAPPAPPAPEQPAEPVAEAPLSSADVDKLLKGENAAGA